MNRVPKGRRISTPKRLENEKDFLKIVRKSAAFKHSRIREYKGQYKYLSNKQKSIIKREFNKFKRKNDIHESDISIYYDGKSKAKFVNVPKFYAPIIDKKSGKILFVADNGMIREDSVVIQGDDLFNLIYKGENPQKYIDMLSEGDTYSIAIGKYGTLYLRGSLATDKEALLYRLLELIKKFSGYGSDKLGEVKRIVLFSQTWI